MAVVNGIARTGANCVQIASEGEPCIQQRWRRSREKRKREKEEISLSPAAFHLLVLSMLNLPRGRCGMHYTENGQGSRFWTGTPIRDPRWSIAADSDSDSEDCAGMSYVYYA